MSKIFSTMTYQDYLSNWESQFGDDDTAEYGYWSYGVHVPTEVHRLTETEFNEHLSGLNKAQESFDIALKANDDNGMGNALSESFPHELVLLI
jgi:hypothetical protein